MLAGWVGVYRETSCEWVLQIMSDPTKPGCQVHFLGTPQERDQSLCSVFQSTSDAIVGVDVEGNIMLWNRGAEKTFGYRASELLGASLDVIIPDALRHAHQKGFENFLATGVPTLIGKTLEVTAVRKGSQAFPIELSLNTWTTGGKRFFSAIIRDVSARKALENRNERSYIYRIAISALLETGLEPMSMEKQLDVALDIILTIPKLSLQSRGGIFVWDSQQHKLCLKSHRGLSDKTTHACASIDMGFCVCGQTAQTREPLFAKDTESCHTVQRAGALSHAHYCLPILSRGNLLGVLNLYVTDAFQDDTDEAAFLSTITTTLAGLIEKRQMEERIRHMAEHDVLTGLPNRLYFKAHLQRELAHAMRDKSVLAALFLDLDKFKQINDTLGHDVGDAVLVQAAQRIGHCLRKSDTLARMGGDEFTLILPELNHSDDAGVIADKIITALREPFEVMNQSCQIGVSIGISLFPQHGETPETLLQRADMAMYWVKNHGRNCFRYFSAQDA